jgi:fermentation-respiration switch protein FrsA (DUF1100 family)
LRLALGTGNLPPMQKAIVWVLGGILGLAILAFGARLYATRAMYNRAVTPKALGTATPAGARIPFSRVPVEIGDRTLIGWWVRARADSGKPAPALLFFHGNRAAISDYVDLQRFFYRQGISTLVFDYSGFGASGGNASLANAVADAGPVAKVFADSAGKTTRRTAFGTGLGATVLLQAIDSVQPHVNGIVIEGVDASAKESAVRTGRLPGWVAPLVVDIADNVTAASRVRVPMLAVHSRDDARVPIADAERIAAAITPPARAAVVAHWRKGHSAIVTSTRPCDWAPVLAFVKDGTLPATKMDTTNACAVEAARVAREKFVADSIAAAVAATKAKSKTPARAPARGTKAPPTKQRGRSQE